LSFNCKTSYHNFSKLQQQNSKFTRFPHFQPNTGDKFFILPFW
jgi:hypothetical protein